MSNSTPSEEPSVNKLKFKSIGLSVAIRSIYETAIGSKLQDGRGSKSINKSNQASWNVPSLFRSAKVNPSNPPNIISAPESSSHTTNKPVSPKKNWIERTKELALPRNAPKAKNTVLSQTEQRYLALGLWRAWSNLDDTSEHQTPDKSELQSLGKKPEPSIKQEHAHTPTIPPQTLVQDQTLSKPSSIKLNTSKKQEASDINSLSNTGTIEHLEKVEDEPIIHKPMMRPPTGPIADIGANNSESIPRKIYSLDDKVATGIVLKDLKPDTTGEKKFEIRKGPYPELYPPSYDSASLVDEWEVGTNYTSASGITLSHNGAYSIPKPTMTSHMLTIVDQSLYPPSLMARSISHEAISRIEL